MTRLLTLILLSCCGFHFFSASVDAKTCTNFQFSRQLGRRLQCAIYKTLRSVDVINCSTKCVSELSCFSHNFYQNENGTDICELIKGTSSSLGDPSCLVWKKGSEYNELSSTGSCSSSTSCEAGKTRKALPGNWYQLGLSAFKLFEQKKNHTEASSVCSANGGALATINSDDENEFVTELYLKEQVSKREQLIKDKLKPHKRWKLDGSDQDVTLLGSLVAKKDEYNRTAALHFTGTAGSYATTPTWEVSTTAFSIALWVKLESLPTASSYFYSHWHNPMIFGMGVVSNAALTFVGRKGNTITIIEEGQIVLNKWMHIAGVWNTDTKQVTLFQDGAKVAQSAPLNQAFPAPSRSVFDVGYKRDTNTVMIGWLRELFVFDRAVTSEEIQIIQDATVLDPRTWIGAPQSFQNQAPVSQPNTDCFTARAWGIYQWEQVPCDRKLKFVCKKPV